MLSGLRFSLLLVAIVLFAMVFGVMFVSVWKHHRWGLDRQVNFHDSVLVEICWALIPCVIVVLLVWPTARIFWVS